MFNEGGSGIGSAKVETVKPWMETLKDMECQVSSKLQNNPSNNDDDVHGQPVFLKHVFTLFFTSFYKFIHYFHYST